MSTARIALRGTRTFRLYSARRAFSVCGPRCNEFEALNKRANDTADEYRRRQMQKDLNPHITNTTSTITNPMPSVGKDVSPPEMLSAVDGKFEPKDAVPENTKKMTGGKQDGKGKAPKAAQKAAVKTQDVQTNDKAPDGELGVGELEGAKFRVEPLRRTGEDANTLRARLLYQSRKRGTLESDLLLSTFADTHLATMSPELLTQYDLFLDENDWDIYYWATQEPTPTSMESAEGADAGLATKNAQGKDVTQEKDQWKREPAKGEWAQTVGTFKPAYRPVPQRWKDSEILGLLRRHVNESKKSEGQSKKSGGLGMMPDIKSFDQ